MAPNYFQLFEEPPRPWLDAEALKEKFHRLSARHHPDQPGGSTEHFAQLNEAMRVLSDPALRLRHLLALEFPEAKVQAQSTMPDSALGDLFMEIGSLQQAVKQWRTRETTAQSPLAKALLVPEKAALRERIQISLTALEAMNERLLEELHALDQQWPQRDAETAFAARLAALASRFTFAAKWEAQLRELHFTLH